MAGRLEAPPDKVTLKETRKTKGPVGCDHKTHAAKLKEFDGGGHSFNLKLELMNVPHKKARRLNGRRAS